jgi:hypothetical protein
LGWTKKNLRPLLALPAAGFLLIIISAFIAKISGQVAGTLLNIGFGLLLLSFFLFWGIGILIRLTGQPRPRSTTVRKPFQRSKYKAAPLSRITPAPPTRGAPASKKYCMDCGTEMTLEGKYCPRCGKRQVEVQTGGMKILCVQCGHKMTITSKGVFYFGSGEPNIVKLRCEQCDITRFERKPDIERELGRTLPTEFTLTPQQY